jgi:hypothetical protein
MLKLGFTLLATGQTPAGTGVLESLTRAFPKHDAARLASFRLAHPDEEPTPTAPLRVGSAPTLGTIVPMVPLPLPAGSSVPALVPATLTPPVRVRSGKETP